MDRSELKITSAARQVGTALTELGSHLVTVESCTGGGIAWYITSIAGSSDWFDRGYVTYSNQAKTDMVGVPADLIQEHGAVSEPVAAAMVQGALDRTGAEFALSVTGIAGPGGGGVGKPVGTVCFAWLCEKQGMRPKLFTETFRFPGDRNDVRMSTIIHSLSGLLNLVNATKCD